MTDHFICICLVFVFLKKSSRTRESDLCDVFFDFVCCHTKTGINEFHSFFFRIYDNLNRSFVIFRKSIFTHDFQFFQFGDGITSVGYQFTDENIVVRI